MKRVFLLVILLVLASGCGPHKTQLSDGKIIPYNNGMILPMAEHPGSQKMDWCIELLFDETSVVMRSPRMLHTCYLSITYEDPVTEKKDVSDVDLDFYDQTKGQYVYALPYSWFPSRAQVENAIQIAVFYGPENVGLPTRTVPTEEGAMTYPDFTGYKFVFNQEEVRKYFKSFTEHLQ